ncbi:MAG: dihydropteroate synthase [Actinobacteria bacterium]|jgi:dihydropteroate synthase|nr:dihydropteroate synthase [Actinomycetota bacterium]MCL6095753.1 dihydropteroate synthase [Actinomycetota bacterium]
MLVFVEPLVMGILNVTPDSFSDGGKFFDYDKAIARGLEMIEQGADIVDVGGESSRPGAARVPEEEELRRVLPVVRELSPLVRVSIDTVKPAVAEAAIEAGATLLNDISASLEKVAAANGVGWVAVHMQGEPATMQRNPHYEDVVRDVRTFLEERAEAGERAGVREIWVDPGIGFGKTVAHNLNLLAHLDALVDTGFPVLVGTSRKSFLGAVLADSSGNPAPIPERFEASLATAVWAMATGASMVRVHDVKATVQAAILCKSMAGAQV